MAIVIDFWGIGGHLHFRFACGYGGANERISRKSAPEQRQRKVKYCVLAKESENLLWHGTSKVMPVPSKGYTGDYPLCASLVTFCAHRKSPQRSVRRTHQVPRRTSGEIEKGVLGAKPAAHRKPDE